jgi:hypothetical protein
MGRLNIYQDGSFEYKFCFLRIILLCVSSIGGVIGRLGIFTCYHIPKLIIVMTRWASCYENVWDKLKCSKKGLWIVHVFKMPYQMIMIDPMKGNPKLSNASHVNKIKIN